jgi:hypothetical protein
VGTYPWHGLHFGNGVRVGNKSEACTARVDDFVRGHSQIVGQVAQNAENGHSRQQRSESVESGDDQSVSVDVMVEGVVRREHDDGAESDVQREETLSDGGVPDLKRSNRHNMSKMSVVTYVRLGEFRPVRFDEVVHALGGALQCGGSDQQRDHDDVRKQRQEVGGFAGTLHPSDRHQERDDPRDEQAQRQSPLRHADPVAQVRDFLEHFLPEGGQQCNEAGAAMPTHVKNNSDELMVSRVSLVLSSPLAVASTHLLLMAFSSSVHSSWHVPHGRSPVNECTK